MGLASEMYQEYQHDNNNIHNYPYFMWQEICVTAPGRSLAYKDDHLDDFTSREAHGNGGRG